MVADIRNPIRFPQAMTAYYPAYQRIYDDITQVQSQLDAALQCFLAQASHSLQLDQQVELRQSMANTQLELEKLKSQYSFTN